jgi:hypothetical protein
MRVRYRDITVPAIGDEELPRVLRKLGLYDDVTSGRATCYICGEVLKLETIGAIALIDDKPVLVCSKPSCIGKVSLIVENYKRSIRSVAK